MSRLTELRGSETEITGRRRRWFTAADMDLVVWYDERGAISGFELYYDKNTNEHAVIWDAEAGYAHLAVDDGEQKPVLDYKQAPILTPDGQLNRKRVGKLFESYCSKLPVELSRFVSGKLRDYPTAAS
jgi:hypothetical protein